MHYVDANVMVYAHLDSGPLGERARSKLTRTLQAGACTSALTLDEVLWAVKRLRGKADALAAARGVLLLDLTVFPVDRRDLESALVHVEGGLDPRDAIHAAVALRRKCKSIVSTDAAFAGVAGLKHDHVK